MNRLTDSVRADAPLPSIRASACPGLVRIVATKDGGLCRIRLPGGALTADAARAVADAAQAFGSGTIEATNRANLQLRGVRPGCDAALTRALVDAGLGPLGGAGLGDDAAALAARDDVRNLMLSPTAGRDPDALFDAAALAAPILAMLQTEPRLAALSPKFSVLLDGGERLAALDHPHDVWLSALSGPDGAHGFAVGLAGYPPLDGGGERCGATRDGMPLGNAASGMKTRDAEALEGIDASSAAAAMDAVNRSARSASIDSDGGHDQCADRGGCDASVSSVSSVSRAARAPVCTPFAAIPAERAADCVRALLFAFLDLAQPGATRMRDVLAAHLPDALAARAEAILPGVWRRDPALAGWRRARPDPLRRFGSHEERDPATCHVGGQPPLGRLDAPLLRALAALAGSHGDRTLRITPWQGVLLPGVPRPRAPDALAALSALGLVCDPSDPLGQVVACAGSAGCSRARADTKADAQHLAARLAEPADVHLTGCERSCALARPAAITLVAAAPGRYDLYRRDGAAGFGRCVARDLTIDLAARRIGAHGSAEDFTDA